MSLGEEVQSSHWNGAEQNQLRDHVQRKLERGREGKRQHKNALCRYLGRKASRRRGLPVQRP